MHRAILRGTPSAVNTVAAIMYSNDRKRGGGMTGVKETRMREKTQGERLRDRFQRIALKMPRDAEWQRADADKVKEILRDRHE